MARPLPRAFRLEEKARDAAKLDRIVQQAETFETTTAAGGTAAGDERRLRGIPVIGRGAAGAISGTDPLRALIAKEARPGR